MSKTKTNYSNRAERVRIEVPSGIMLALFALLIALNRWVGAFLTYALTYIFGVLYAIPLIILFIYGMRLIFIRHRHWPLKVSTTIGIILLLLAVQAFMAYLEGTNYENVSFAVLPSAEVTALGVTWKESFTQPLPFAFNGGGLFGQIMFLGLFRLLGKFGSLIALSLIALFGLVIIFWALIRKGLKAAKAKNKRRSARKKFFTEAATPGPDLPEEISDVNLVNRPRQLHKNDLALQRAVFVDEKPIDVLLPHTDPIADDLKVDNTPLSSSSQVSEISEQEEQKNVSKEIATLPWETARVNEEVETNLYEQMGTPSVNISETKEENSQKDEQLVREETNFSEQNLIQQNNRLPDISILERRPEAPEDNKNRDLANERVQIINQALLNLNVGAEAVSYTIGPAVTRYDIKMNVDTPVSQVAKVISDISIRLGGIPARFEALVRGKKTSGLEIANKSTTTVGFRECFAALPALKGDTGSLYFPFGRDISGEVMAADLAEFPHLLVAGSTGSGKSVFMHSLIMTLIMRNRPDQLRLIIIDPKRVEMARYRDMPHLFCPIITDYSEAKVAMSRLVGEMEERYRRFEEAGVSKITQYNEYAAAGGLELMPRIVVVIDEYADLVEGAKDIATPIVRLAQKSRAAGIHLVISTQRPSVNVITGVIKANLSVRVALMMASTVDSVTILNEGGAEQLLGNGDMLVDCPQLSRQGTIRVQGTLVEPREIRRVIDFLKHQFPLDYHPLFADLTDRSAMGPGFDGASEEENALYPQVRNWVLRQEYTSISKIQRAFNFGYPRAMRMFKRLQTDGLIDPADSANSARGSKVIPPHEGGDE